MNMYLITWYPFHFFFKYWCLYLLSSQARYSAHLILAEFSFKFAENCFVVSYNIHLCNFRYSTMSDEKYIFFFQLSLYCAISPHGTCGLQIFRPVSLTNYTESLRSYILAVSGPEVPSMKIKCVYGGNQASWCIIL